MQIAVLEEQKNEATEQEDAEKVEEEPKPTDVDSSAAEPARKNETLDEKPDINDVPMEESQVLLCLCLHYFMFIYILELMRGHYFCS